MQPAQALTEVLLRRLLEQHPSHQFVGRDGDDVVLRLEAFEANVPGRPAVLRLLPWLMGEAVLLGARVALKEVPPKLTSHWVLVEPPGPADATVKRLITMVAQQPLANLHAISRNGGYQCLVGTPLTELQMAAEGLTTAAVEHVTKLTDLQVEAIAQAHGPTPLPLHTQLEGARGFIAAIQNRRAPVTWALIVAGALLYMLEWYFGEGHLALSSRRMGAGSGAAVLSGEVWRLLSASMLHGNLAHLVLNGYSLWVLGIFLEKVLGSARFLSIFVLSALAGGVLSAVRVEGTSVGASGGIWGLMLACAALVTWPRGVLPALVANSMRNRVWTVVGINALLSFAPGIDLLAHGGGGLMGLFLTGTGLTLRGLPQASEPAPATLPSKPGWSITAALLATALVASVGIAIVEGKPWELLHPVLHSVALEGTSLQIDLPTSFEPVTPREREGVTFFRWERFGEDGLDIVLAIAPRRLDMTEEEWLTRSQASVNVGKDVVLVDQPQIRTLYGRQVVTFSTRQPGSELLRRGTLGLVGDYQVRFETVAADDVLTDAWKALEHSLYFGIR